MSAVNFLGFVFFRGEGSIKLEMYNYRLKQDSKEQMDVWI